MAENHMRNPQAAIARLMCEDIDMVSPLSGMQSQTAMGMSGSDSEAQNVMLTSSEPTEEEEKPTTEQLKITKRFVELVGGMENARTLLDKLDECDDCIDLLDDEGIEHHETGMISQMAELVPDLPDLPTMNSLSLSALYNPSAMNKGSI